MNRALLVFAWLLNGALAAAPSLAADLAIVVDDLGYSVERAEQVLTLPQPVTLGLLPFAPATPEIARRAHASGHEVILHQPMEPLPPAHRRPVPGTLTVGMSAESFVAQLDAALAAVPGMIGVNNHTGSRLTQDPAAMRQLMHYLSDRNLLFLDSRTTPATVAYAMAREARVPAVQRDVFLDHVPHPRAIDVEFQRALGIARRQGHAVIIAHPHAASLDYLTEALARLPDGVRVVSLQGLAQGGHPATLARRESPDFPNRSLGQ